VSDKHRIELRNRRRRKNETLQSLHNDVRRLAALAYPEAQPKTREVISCDHFLDAIADPDLELKICERQPSDLDSALNIALQLEVWSADSERRREVQKWEKGEAKKIREISNRTGPGASGNSGQQGNFRQSSSFRHTALNAYGGAPRGQYPPGSRGQHPTNYGAKPGTYHAGTFARPPVNPGAHGNPRLPNQFAGCFQCGDLTHFLRNCPVFPAEQQGQPHYQNPSQFHSPQQPYQPPQQPYQPPPHPLQPPPQQPPQPDVRPLKDRSGKPDKTCIWVRYRQYRLSALIDTGSDVSIASEDIANRMGWEIHAPSNPTVNVANNNVMTISGVVRVPLKIGDYRTDSEILISPDFEGLILGYDWITQQGRLDLDIPRDRMRIGTGRWIQVHSSEPFVKVCRIFATKDVVIPARGQANVAARLLHNAWTCTARPASYGVMESQPISTMEHVYSGRTLLSTPLTEVQVPILNARAQDITVAQGTLLGKVFTAKTAVQEPSGHVRRIQTGESISPAHEEVIQ